MPVNSQHKQYRKFAKRWSLVRAVVDNDAMDFIRPVDSADIERSLQYKKEAILTNFTALTKMGLTGLVFRKPGTYILPPEIEYLLEDATGEDLALDQLSQRLVGETLETGRHGLLVDYPPAPMNLSKDEENAYQYAAHIKNYAAESIINWKTTTIGGKVKLELVVLTECVDEIGSDGFEWAEKTQYRVLRLIDGVYTQSIYNEDLELLSTIIPIKKNGQEFTYIPFTFIGSENNDSNVDAIPLEPLAVINIGHYRNSADLEESGHVCGQPTLFLSAELDHESFKAANPNGVKFGSRQGIFLGAGGTAQLLQANPNQLISQMMLDKKEYAVGLGARFIAPAGGRETAEAARIRFGSQNSALCVLTKNISEALENCLEWACDFMGGDPSIVEYELNDQFYEPAADPVMVMAQIQLFDRSLITSTEVRDTLRITGVIDPESTDDGIAAQAHIANPLDGSYGA